MPFEHFNEKYVTTIRSSARATTAWATSAVHPLIAGANMLTVLLNYTRGSSSNCHIRVYTAYNTTTFYLAQTEYTLNGGVYLYDRTYIVTSAGKKCIPCELHGERAAIAVRVSGASVTNNTVEIKALVDRV